MARDTTTKMVAREIRLWASSSSLAQSLIGATSVGLKAVAVV